VAIPGYRQHQAGSPCALLEGRNVYELRITKAAEVYAGERVRVSGMLDEKTKRIAVESISPAR
jgi:hypothetical protein